MYNPLKTDQLAMLCTFFDKSRVQNLPIPPGYLKVREAEGGAENNNGDIYRKTLQGELSIWVIWDETGRPSQRETYLWQSCNDII